MRIAITGATGFIGSFLVDALLEAGDEVDAWVRSPPTKLPAQIRFHQVELLDRAAVARQLERDRPDAIFHLAAQSLPGRSWQDPWETLDLNVTGTLNLLEAAAKSSYPGPLVVFGSSSEYGAQANPDKPIDEQHQLSGGSPYAVSKITSSQLVSLYHRRYGLNAMIVRPFFWIGPRKTGDFSSDVARNVVRIEKGELQDLPVGNLEAVRDFLDVRDGVNATLVLTARGMAGEAYNICSGKGVLLRDAVEIYRGLSTRAFTIKPDPALLRPLDERVRVGDPSKVMQLGWRPGRDIKTTMSDILDYWRQKA